MSADSERTLIGSLRNAFGATRPAPGWWAWLRDPHFLIAVLAAVPVWPALGMAVGDRMQLTFTVVFLTSFLVVQPVAEELVFRGALQGLLLQHGGSRGIGPVSLANLATTAAFVAMHFAAQPPAWALAVAIPSLVFGHLRERFASALPAIALHSIYNIGFAITAWCVHR
jgi:membrane protease YdiL (CAAX protease family)